MQVLMFVTSPNDYIQIIKKVELYIIIRKKSNIDNMAQQVTMSVYITTIEESQRLQNASRVQEFHFITLTHLTRANKRPN